MVDDDRSQNEYMVTSGCKLFQWLAWLSPRESPQEFSYTVWKSLSLFAMQLNTYSTESWLAVWSRRSSTLPQPKADICWGIGVKSLFETFTRHLPFVDASESLVFSARCACSSPLAIESSLSSVEGLNKWWALLVVSDFSRDGIIPLETELESASQPIGWVVCIIEPNVIEWHFRVNNCSSAAESVKNKIRGNQSTQDLPYLDAAVMPQSASCGYCSSVRLSS